MGDPVISMIPSLEQHQQSITLVLPSFSSITTLYVNIASTKKGPVLLDGQSISVTWNNIYNNGNNTVGYGAQIQFNYSSTSVSYTISMQSTFSALVYGFGSNEGFSYSAGVNLEQLVQSMYTKIYFIYFIVLQTLYNLVHGMETISEEFQLECLALTSKNMIRLIFHLMMWL